MIPFGFFLSLELMKFLLGACDSRQLISFLYRSPILKSETLHLVEVVVMSSIVKFLDLFMADLLIQGCLVNSLSQTRIFNVFVSCILLQELSFPGCSLELSFISSVIFIRKIVLSNHNWCNRPLINHFNTTSRN